MAGDVCTWCQQELDWPPAKLVQMRSGSQDLPAGALLEQLAAGHKSKSRYDREPED